MKRYNVQCPHCNGVFLQTNGLLRLDKPANGSMFDTLQHVKDAGWTVFPLYDSTEYADLVCPSCDQVLVDSLGKIIRLEECGEIDEVRTDVNAIMDALMNDYEPDIPVKPVPQPVADKTTDTHLTDDKPKTPVIGKTSCPVCGVMYANKGLPAHIKAKHPEYQG